MDPETIKTLVPIFLALVLLMAMLLSWLSSKTWRIGHVVLVFFLILFSGVYWYMAAVVLKVHQSYRQEVNRLEAQLRQQEATIDALKNDTDDEAVKEVLLAQQNIQLVSGGIRQLNHEIGKLTSNRGRVWQDVAAARPDAEGKTTVTIEEPSPHNIEVGTVLFAFQQGEPGEAAYLGEFKAAAVQENEGAAGTVSLEPTMVMTPRELAKLGGQNATWILYEVMPIDTHEPLTSLDDAQLEAYFPAASVEEYKKDGKPAAADDPEDRVIDGKYVRRLRDYELNFHELHRQRYVTRNAIEQRQRDQQLLNEAEANTKKDIALREAEKKKLESDKARFEKERTLVEQQRDKVQQVVASVRKRLDEVIKHNEQLAAELARIQLELSDEIERRTAPKTASTGVALKAGTAP